MATIARPRVITKPELGAADLPEQVAVALAELASAAKEGLLALSVGRGAGGSTGDLPGGGEPPGRAQGPSPSRAPAGSGCWTHLGEFGGLVARSLQVPGRRSRPGTGAG